MPTHAHPDDAEQFVLCPRTCHWEPADHCPLCRYLAAFEERESGEAGGRRPEREHAATAARLTHV